MKFFDREAVESLFPMAAAIDVIERAMCAVSAGEAVMPLRRILPLGGGNIFGVMPCAMREPPAFGAKLLSIFPENTKLGLGSHLGLVILFEAEHGAPVAILDAGAVTAIRTAAASGAATRSLARQDASTVAIIGTGEQAIHHLEAMLAVRPVRSVRIVGRTREKAEAFAGEAARHHPHLDVSAGADARTATRDADIICTLTNSATTVLMGEWVAAGAHINCVGASAASKQEVDEELVARASLFVDCRESAFAEAGEIINAIASGRIARDHIVGEIGEIFAGMARGRTSADEITLYRSLGIAAQDIAAAHYIVRRAAKPE